MASGRTNNLMQEIICTHLEKKIKEDEKMRSNNIAGPCTVMENLIEEKHLKEVLPEAFTSA